MHHHTRHCIITLGIHLSSLRMLEAAIQEEYDTHRTTRAEINGLTVYCPIAQAFLSLSVYISRRKRRVMTQIFKRYLVPSFEKDKCQWK